MLTVDGCVISFIGVFEKNINFRIIQVEVYAAPHLSTPCCLAEPVLVYSIQELPSLYWKRYNDAGRVVEQIKRKTPKVCRNRSQADQQLLIRV